MIGIAAVFGAVSIFAADFWLKSEASAQVETRTIEIPRRLSRRSSSRRSSWRPSRCATACSSIAPSSRKSRGRRTPRRKVHFRRSTRLLAEGSRVVLSPMEANEPVLLAKLSGPNGRASLSNLLTPGMRAVTIKTDEIAGVGGFITPGDRVDVVLTRDAGAIDEVKKNAEGAAGSTIASEIVVENAKVLSVGQGADERQTEAADRQLRSRSR